MAAERGWHDRAVYALNRGEDLHYYDLRFPLARRTDIVRDARSAGIDPTWAYAIIRAESAWTTDARSGADAFGLMQLLPGTAKHLAKQLGVSFSGASALFDPDLNIRLGTQYLGKMALRYDGSPWLASAAYNAGSDPVGRWIDARDSLDPDFFIETIPYKETREYVARVLAFAVIYDWRSTARCCRSPRACRASARHIRRRPPTHRARMWCARRPRNPLRFLRRQRPMQTALVFEMIGLGDARNRRFSCRAKHYGWRRISLSPWHPRVGTLHLQTRRQVQPSANNGATSLAPIHWLPAASPWRM